MTATVAHFSAYALQAEVGRISMSLKQVVSVPLQSVQQQMTLKTDAPCSSWCGTIENRHLMEMTA